MAWAALDDKFHAHPTTWEVGLEANGLCARAISYAADQLTDGFLPEAWVGANVPKRSAGIVQKLIDAGLWERLDNGYRILGYLDYNPPAAVVKSKREAARQRRQKGGARSRERTANVTRTSRDGNENVA